MANTDLSTVPVPSENALVRRLGEETVFLAPDGRLIHTVNAIGTFIWDQIDGQANLEEIRTLIVGAYNVDEAKAGNDLSEFVSELCEAGLVILQN